MAGKKKRKTSVNQKQVKTAFSWQYAASAIKQKGSYRSTIGTDQLLSLIW